uniref:Stress-enhanced protein 3 n=1 Tax=Glaucocystis nostochinearum TaxID=38271 RepID=D9PTQ6_9EUKA|nr:TPA_inf: stress-enhanced protein 3 [Glaucocystis nostochinearum]|eukprot:EC124901.1.p1 GENE.EC124901.1~~EC124901.1.p1  ORF type:complete len:188 (+),score=18.52 EC124901.1:92-655(+)
MTELAFVLVTPSVLSSQGPSGACLRNKNVLCSSLTAARTLGNVRSRSAIFQRATSFSHEQSRRQFIVCQQLDAKSAPSVSTPDPPVPEPASDTATVRLNFNPEDPEEDKFYGFSKAAETVNGRIAMIGIVSSFVVEYLTGETIWEQLSIETGLEKSKLIGLLTITWAVTFLAALLRVTLGNIRKIGK